MNRHLLRRVVMHNAGSSPLCFETCAVILSAPGDWYVFRKVMEFKTLSVVKKHGGLGGGGELRYVKYVAFDCHFPNTSVSSQGGWG